MKKLIQYLSILIILTVIIVALFPGKTSINNVTDWIKWKTHKGYDVIVIGGDPEGVTAAVSAARNGAKTLLVCEEDGLGGLLTFGMLNTLDMNYNKAGELLTKGIFDEFYDKIGRTESFSVELVKQIFEDMVSAEKNIEYKSNLKFTNAIVKDNTIKGIVVEDKSGNTQRFYGKRIIDATQNGDVCAYAGVPYLEGMEDINIDGKMATTLVFQIGGVNWEELRRDIERYSNETGDTNCGINQSSAWGFGKWCYGNYTAVYDNMKLRGPNIGLQEDGSVLINALQIFDVDAFNEESIKNAKARAEIEAKNAFEYLKSKLNSFSNAFFIGTAPELYIRETRHIQGEYILQASDLLSGINFEDKIAMASYPVDIQSTNKNNNGQIIFKPDQYSIPYRCIVPKNIDNLFIIGKSASYSSVAAGSARVVPVGMVVGESAGTIAVYSIKNSLTPRNIIGNNKALKEITDRLVNQGVYLPDYTPNSDYANMTGFEEISELVNYGIISGGYDNNFKFDSITTQIESLDIIKNFASRKYGMNVSKINQRLEAYSSQDEIDAVTLIRMIYSIKNDDNIMDDLQLWDYAKKQSWLKNCNITDMNQILTNKDLYIIVVNSL